MAKQEVPCALSGDVVSGGHDRLERLRGHEIDVTDGNSELKGEQPMCTVPQPKREGEAGRLAPAA